jgi:hypothetical protein
MDTFYPTGYKSCVLSIHFSLNQCNKIDPVKPSIIKILF